jgi:hypothetical protein
MLSKNMSRVLKSLSETWKLDGSYVAADKLEITNLINARQALLLLELMGEITRCSDNSLIIDITPAKLFRQHNSRSGRGRSSSLR